MVHRGNESFEYEAAPQETDVKSPGETLQRGMQRLHWWLLGFGAIGSLIALSEYNDRKAERQVEIGESHAEALKTLKEIVPSLQNLRLAPAPF